VDDFLRLMTYPFLACLLLAGIHVYLGIHVISRKVIFVDLALAQIAAFGAVYGMALGYDVQEHPWTVKGFSLLFAIAGAAVFSLTRMRHDRVPQEAIIGITYAAAMAATILASAHLPHGADEMRELLSGSILWVKPETLLHTAWIYGTIGAFHWIFRRRFLLISLDPERAEAEGLHVRLWDFLFYLSFGIVVTSSVAIAGVLLVFTYLVIPAVVAVLFAERVGTRLAVGWTVGCLISILGVTISYTEDLPSGPTIVVAFAAFLVGSGVVYYLLHARIRSRGVLRVALGGLVVVAFGLTPWFLRHPDEQAPLDLLRSATKNQRLIALKVAAAEEEEWGRVRLLAATLLQDPDAEVRTSMLELIGQYGEEALLPEVEGLLADPDDLVREEALRCVRRLGRPSSVAALLDAANAESDEFLRVEIAEAVLELGDPRGIPLLIDSMDGSDLLQVRKDAHEHLAAHTRIDLPFRADDPPEANDDEIAAYRRWWQEQGGALVWQRESGTFVRKR